jgi:hypothetical protein
MVAGALACWMTGAVASLFIGGQGARRRHRLIAVEL